MVDPGGDGCRTLYGKSDFFSAFCDCRYPVFSSFSVQDVWSRRHKDDGSDGRFSWIWGRMPFAGSRLCSGRYLLFGQTPLQKRAEEPSFIFSIICYTSRTYAPDHRILHTGQRRIRRYNSFDCLSVCRIMHRHVLAAQISLFRSK